jgi:hypothetical protein
MPLEALGLPLLLKAEIASIMLSLQKEEKLIQLFQLLPLIKLIKMRINLMIKLQSTQHLLCQIPQPSLLMMMVKSQIPNQILNQILNRILTL